jgi:hypothetical protein
MVKLQIIVPVRGLSWAEIERELRACFEVCPPHAVTIDFRMAPRCNASRTQPRRRG